MPLNEMMGHPITGIHPFNELPIDAEIWHEAHEHHHHHRQLHALSAHRPGIVCGLEVLSLQERKIAVAPGVGIDTEGQTIILAEPVYLTLLEKGQTYITLSFLRTADRHSGIKVGSGQQYYRLIEGRNVKATQELPRTAYLELARIYRSNAAKSVLDATDALDPTHDELNLLHRSLSFPYCSLDAAVGELSYVPVSDPKAWKPNRGGLAALLHVGNGQGLHLDFTGPLNLRAQPLKRASDRNPVLLYVAGHQGFQPLAGAEINGLRSYLSDGGMLLGESSRDNKEFRQCFEDLALKVGAKLKKIELDNPLLSVHYIFSAPPPGASVEGELLADIKAGVILSTYDYGAVWQGQVVNPHDPWARERIRQAQEFGLNFIALAARRRRRSELSCLIDGLTK